MKILKLAVRIILLILAINIVMYLGIIIFNKEAPEYSGTFVKACQEV